MAVGRPSRDEIYTRLDFQIAELWNRFGGLPSPAESQSIWRGIWFEEAHHSTALEGNTLVRKEVETLLEQGRAIGNKQLVEYMEVRGYANAAEWVYSEAIVPGRVTESVITVSDVREIHRLALQPVWDVAPHPDAGDDESPGSFRRHDIHPFPGGMTPPSWPLVDPELTGWVSLVNALQPRSLRFPEHIAELHAKFERIHPFIDGNGRTGRLVLNLVLVRLGYPPAIFYKKQRAKYLAALRQADVASPGPLGEMTARAILDNLYRFVLPNVAGPARLVPLAALASEEFNLTAMRVAAGRGALQATRGADGQWRSSQLWVQEYRKTRQRKK